MKTILVLDDVRTFADSAVARFVHARSDSEALDALGRCRCFDEIWLDYDLSATARHDTSIRFARYLRCVDYAGTVVLITDLDAGALAILRVLPNAQISEMGCQWNCSELGLDPDDGFVGRVTEAALAEGIALTCHPLGTTAAYT